MYLSYTNYFYANPPECPSDWGGNNFSRQDIAYPSTVVVCSLVTLTCIIITCIIGFRYNSVKVFNRKIRTKSISNTLWILFFLTVGLRNAIDAVLFSVQNLTESTKDILSLQIYVFHGIGCLTLCLALNHQRKYRSSVPPENLNKNSYKRKETEPLIPKHVWCKSMCTPSEIFFLSLFVLFLIFLYLQAVKEHKIFDILFIVFTEIQRIPVLILMFMIIFFYRANDGPTRQSKIFLFMASILNVTGDIPLNIWAFVLPSNCTFVIASWLDFIHILYLISLFMMFIFVRNEYHRNMEETIWSTVSQIQDTF